MRHSYGPRADRLLHLLLMPGFFSATALLQLFLPRAEPVCTLWRNIQASLCLVRLIELLYILCGGWSNVKLRLPKEPIQPYAGPPLCCCFMWPSCTREVTEKDIEIMVMGVRQFCFVTPFLGSIDAYASTASVLGVGWTASVVHALHMIYVASSILGVWSFNNLYALLSHGVPRAHRKWAKLRLLCVSCQIFSVKTVSVIIENGLRELGARYDNGNWALNDRLLATLASGCYLCVVELVLLLVLRKAFPVGEALYPAPVLPNVYPVDMLASVELCGVPHGVYEGLQQFEKRRIDDDESEQSSSEAQSES